MPTPRSQLEIMRMAAEDSQSKVHTAFPATVVAFYPGTAAAPPTADIEIMIARPMVDLVTQTIAYEKLPLIPQVPIAFPRGGGFVMAFPLLPGDEVLFICTMYDFEGYRTSGQASNPVDPTPHGLQGWAVPCSIKDTNPLASFTAAAAGLVIGADGKPGVITIPTGGASVGIGAVPVGHAAVAELVATELGKIATALSSLVAPPGGGPCTGNTYVSPSSVAATVAKVQ